MFLYPEAQRKAQDELDSVLSGKRLPDFDDRQSLHYLDAAIHETMRWHPTAPFGMHESA